jgi:hypothetical protein
MSFRAYFGAIHMCFVLRDDNGAARFVRAELARLGVAGYELVVLDAPTRGQAETVALGLRRLSIRPDDSLTIFNIDTFRPGFAYPREPWFAGCDGYLEVVAGMPGDAWSFVEPDGQSNRVRRTTEKLRISDFACTGLYHFARARHFQQAYQAELRAPSQCLSERYVAPLYNHLIGWGLAVRLHQVSRKGVVLCGVPEEYRALLMPERSLLEKVG